MSDIRTAWKDFSGDLTLNASRVRGKIIPTLLLDFANDTANAIAKWAAIGGTVVRAGATATRINAQGLIEVVPANTLRIDFDPVTLSSKGLLIEEARTNLLVRSAEFDNAAWTKTANGTAAVPVVTPNDAVGPFGTQTADKVVMTLNGGATIGDSCQVGQPNVATVAGVDYAGSIYVKGTPGEKILLRHAGSGAYVAWQFTGGWDRITRIENALGVSTTFDIALRGTLGSSNSVTFWMEGAQLEQGSFATSHIPTGGVAVQRNVDQLKATALGGWLGSVAHTVLTEFSCKTTAASSYSALFELNDGTTGNRLRGLMQADGLINLLTQNGAVVGANYQTVNAGVVDDVVINRVAHAFKSGDYAMSLNGGAIAANANAQALPTATQLWLGSAEGGAGLPLNGHLRRLSYVPRRLSNAQLQMISVPGAPLTLDEESDIGVIDGLDEDDGLATAVVLSLFTDRRAQPGDALPQGTQLGGTPDRRGWWGDSFAPVPGDKIGSRRWLLFREKLTQSVVARLADYDREALQWLVDDGIARAVNVTTERQGNERIAELIEIVRSDKPVVQYRFNSFWKAV